jgi:ferredoxin
MSDLSDTTPFSVEVDRELCQTAAVCLAYGVYELDDEGIALLLKKHGDEVERVAEGIVPISELINPDNATPEVLQQRLLDSAKACPFNAILVRNQKGDLIWPPEF